MKKFINEFKKFINRGNVIDLAVGVIIGGAFSAIVTALTSNILQPLINALITVIFGSSSNQPVYTFLIGNETDIANAIYIDWGAFISAIINFFIIAFVLFVIIKAFNKINEQNSKLQKELLESRITRADIKEMKALKLNYKDIKEVKKFKEEKIKKAELEKQKLEEEAKAKEEEAKKHTTEGLLEQIKELLEKKDN